MLKEFNNHIDISFSEETGPVYICDEDKTYQAFFLPIMRKNEDE